MPFYCFHFIYSARYFHGHLLSTDRIKEISKSNSNCTGVGNLSSEGFLGGPRNDNLGLLEQIKFSKLVLSEAEVLAKIVITSTVLRTGSSRFCCHEWQSPLKLIVFEANLRNMPTKKQTLCQCFFWRVGAFYAPRIRCIVTSNIGFVY